MAVDHHLVMQMRSGREAARTQEAEHLTLFDAQAFFDAARESGHVVVGGHVSVGVLDLDAPAVPRVPLRLGDRAVARGENRRADWRRPIDARMHLGVTWNRMTAVAEA